jgi:hypothetical protein
MIFNPARPVRCSTSGCNFSHISADGAKATAHQAQPRTSCSKHIRLYQVGGRAQMRLAKSQLAPFVLSPSRRGNFFSELIVFLSSLLAPRWYVREGETCIHGCLESKGRLKIQYQQWNSMGWELLPSLNPKKYSRAYLNTRQSPSRDRSGRARPSNRYIESQ